MGRPVTGGQHQDETLPTAVLMASGGLDSTVLAYWLLSRGVSFRCLFLDYGQHCANTELATLREILPAAERTKVHVARVGTLLEASPSRLVREADLWLDRVVASDLIIPYRNLLFLSAGSAYAASIGAQTLYSAFINSNHALEIDATREFLDGVTKLFGKVGGVRLEMPFRDMTKTEVARIGLSLGAPIAKTYSCQVSSTVHCGSCPNCVDRIEALLAAAATEAEAANGVTASVT